MRELATDLRSELHTESPRPRAGTGGSDAACVRDGAVEVGHSPARVNPAASADSAESNQISATVWEYH